MIIHNLRSIRILINTICQQHYSHERRNKRLAVMERTIDRLITSHETWLGGDNWLADYPDLRAQLIDGLRSLRLLTHPNLNDEDLVLFETHSDVKDRLRLMGEVVSFLIEKAEEAQPVPDVAPIGNRDTGEIPF